MIRIIGIPEEIKPMFSGKEEWDILELDWFETARTTLRKYTKGNREVGIRKSSVPLSDGQIIYQDSDLVISVSIRPVSCIVFRPGTYRDMSIICFEIGNKHIPIFITEDAEVIIEFERPLFRLLERFGFEPTQEVRKLLKTHSLTINNHRKAVATPILIKLKT
jgi:urease accessory protein